MTKRTASSCTSTKNFAIISDMQPSTPSPMTSGPMASPPLSQSQKHHYESSVVAVVIFVLLVVLLIGAIAFGVWSFMGRQDYKNNSDKKSAIAVTKAEAVLSAKKDADFAEQEKSPFKSYVSPVAFGAVTIMYPKTWSAYVNEATSGQASQPVDAYFNPNFVPAVDNSNGGNLYALRMQVTNNVYDQELKSYESYIKAGQLKVSAFTPKLVPGSVGVRLEGLLDGNKKQGSMVILPLRDKTVKVWTENMTHLDDLNKTLDSLTFKP